MTTDPELMPLTPADAPALATLHGEALAALGQQPWPAETFADLLELPTTLGFKVNVGGETAAFILAQAAGGEAEILTLATTRTHRRKGMARSLIDVVQDQCRIRNCTALWLEVHADNRSAIALYEQAGFCPKGQRPDYYRDMRTGKRHTAIVMQRHV